MASLLERILRTGDKKTLKTLRAYADTINTLEDEFREMSDEELKAETDKFRARLAEGEKLEALLPEAFAAVREASDRVLGMRKTLTYSSWVAPHCIWVISLKCVPVKVRPWLRQHRLTSMR